MTDSSVAIDETKEFSEYNWHYLDRKRFKADEGGWEVHNVVLNNAYAIYYYENHYHFPEK